MYSVPTCGYDDAGSSDSIPCTSLVDILIEGVADTGNDNHTNEECRKCHMTIILTRNGGRVKCTDELFMRCHMDSDLYGMWVHKLCQGVQIFNLLFPESSAVAPVQGGNVLLNSLHHLCPLVTEVLRYRPTKLTGIFKSVA